MHILIAVEGPHDIAVVGKLLARKGFEALARLEQLTPGFARLVPRSFPHGGDLVKRVPLPMFFRSGETNVAVQSGNNVVLLLRDMREQVGLYPIDAFAVMLDADSYTAEQKFYEVRAQWVLEIPDLTTPDEIGVCMQNPRTGIFVAPNCHALGTIEDLLLEAGGDFYPNLLAHAAEYIEAAAQIPDVQRELRALNKPAGRKKATLAAAASILKPGKAIQMSIQDNRWLDGDAAPGSAFRRLKDFVDDLLAGHE